MDLGRPRHLNKLHGAKAQVPIQVLFTTRHAMLFSALSRSALCVFPWLLLSFHAPFSFCACLLPPVLCVSSYSAFGACTD